MGYRRLEGLLPFFLAVAVLLLPLKWLLAVILAGAIHELGHYFALKLCGVPILGVRISVTGARMEIGSVSRWQECFCALAGPLAGFSLLLVSRWLPRTAVCACIHSAYNLLPVYPLDGGRGLRCTGIGERFCQWTERLCLCLTGFAGVYGSVGLGLGITPVLLALLTIHRALAGKGLAKRLAFRYNRERIYE